LEKVPDLDVEKTGNFGQSGDGRGNVVVLDLGDQSRGEARFPGHILQRQFAGLAQGFDLYTDVEFHSRPPCSILYKTVLFYADIAEMVEIVNKIIYPG